MQIGVARGRGQGAEERVTANGYRVSSEVTRMFWN